MEWKDRIATPICRNAFRYGHKIAGPARQGSAKEPHLLNEIDTLGG